MKSTNQRNFNLTFPIIKIPKEAENYFNLFNSANSAINTAVASPLLAMRTLISAINAPALFAVNATQRVNLLNNQFNLLHKTLGTLVSPGSKQVYQNLAGSLISSMVLASAFPLETDSVSSAISLSLIGVISSAFRIFMADLDSLSTLTGGSPLSFIPDATSIIALSELISLGVSSLLIIALSAKQERSIITESDTNIILLTHRFYGLDNNDNNINELLINNSLGLNSLLQIRKGTKIIYYI